MKITDYTEGMQPEPGQIIRGMPNEIYHIDNGFLSSSGLSLFARSPAHYYCAKPREATRAMALGSAAHAAVLEPDAFERDYILLPDVADRRQAAYKDAAKQYGADFVLTGADAENITGMQQALAMNTDFQVLMAMPGETELSFFGQCPVTGVRIKCRFDLLAAGRHALDLKTTQDVRHDSLERSILNYRYFMQQVFYEHVFAAVTGEQLDSYRFLFVESGSPHSNVMVTLCDETQTLARRQLEDELQQFAANKNPADGIAQEPAIIGLPGWYLSRHADEEIS